MGSARLTCIHEYRISCNRSLRLVLERCRLSWHVLEEIRSAAAGPSAQHRLQQVLLGLEFSQNQSSCFANFPKTPTWLLKPNMLPKSPRIELSNDTFAERKCCQVYATNRKHFTVSDPMAFPFVTMWNKNPQNLPFPLHDVDSHLIQQCLGPPHAPPQTAATTVEALSHTYAVKSPLDLSLIHI